MDTIMEESESEEESLSGSDSDTNTVIGADSEEESRTNVDNRAEGVVGAHTGARSKETKRTCKEEIYTDKYVDDNDEDDDNDEGDDDDDNDDDDDDDDDEYSSEDDDFNYYDEDWAPDNPFEAGALTFHPDDPINKRYLIENEELPQKDISQRNEPKSEKYASFKKFHKDARAEVERMDQLIKSYFKTENNFERARFVLSLETSKALNLSTILGKKSETRAAELEETFDFEERKNKVVAFEAISDSIQLTKGNSYRNLSQRFSKRGGFLCNLGKFEEAFRDARRSFVFGDNLDLMWYSYITLGRCYMSKHLWEKARYCFCRAQEGVQVCDLNEMQRETVKTTITYYLNEIEQIFPQEKFKQKKGAKHIQEEEIINYGIDFKINLPDLARGSNKSATNVSSLVCLGLKAGQGRGLYASDDIEPGDVLIVEKPYASAVHHSKSDSNCCICFKKVFNPIPCSLCEDVWYCSEKCMSSSIVRHIHEHECEVLPYLQDPDIENMTLLTYRIITRFSWQKLKQYLPAINTSRSDLAENFERFNKIDDEHIEIVQNINPNIFFLKTNGKSREFDDLFKKSMASVYILECLRIGGYFKDDPPTREENVRIVSIALKHMQAAECNANMVYEYMTQQDGDCIEIGSAIYPLVSNTNHSCFPNAFRYYINNVCILRAIRSIKKGKQIFDSYDISYDAVPREIRLLQLSKVYKFECKCEACEGNWPLLGDNLEPLKIPCPEDKCTENIIFNLDKETGCPHHGCNTKKIFDLIKHVNSRLRVLYRAKECIRHSILDMDTIISLKEFQILLNIIYPPSKYVTVCQEVFKRVFMREGNIYRTFRELLSPTF